MSFISLRNKLAYPAGVRPGFDPTHVAATKTRFSAIAGGANFVSLLNGAVGTQSGTPTPTTNIIGGVGPSVRMGTSGSNTSAVTFANQPLISDTTVTVGSIIQLTDNGTGQGILANTTGTNGWWFSLSMDFGNPWVTLSTSNGVNVNAAFSGLTNIPKNVPLFIGASASNSLNAGYAIISNMATGQTYTQSMTGSGLNTAASNGTYVIGNGVFTNTTRNFYGYIGAVMLSGAYLSPSQLLQWASDPWSFWYPATKADPRTWLNLVGIQTSSSITGTLTATEGNDTLSSAGTVKVSGTASITEAADTLSASGTILVAGTLSVTESADTLSATGVTGNSGTLSITEAPDTLSAAGAILIAANLSATEADDALSANGAILITGSASLTEAPDTLTSGNYITGALSLTEADDTINLAAFIYTPPNTTPNTWNPGTEWQWYDRLLESKRRPIG